MKKMVPLQHTYIKNLYKHKDELSLGNDIRIAVEHTKGDIFDKEFIETLRKITEEGFYLPGVNKGKVRSLWTPNVRWTEADEFGFSGGEMIPPGYNGSKESLLELQRNVLKSDQIGRLVADNLRSTIVYLPLIEQDSNKPENNNDDDIDYRLFSEELESNIRQQFESDSVKIHVIGFAKKVGDLIEGVKGVLGFFIITVIITFHLLIFDCRCVRSAGVILIGSLMAVAWQLGIVTLLRKLMVVFRESEYWLPFLKANPAFESIQFGLDPYSMLVPFLVFAIAVSHGVQYVGEMSAQIAEGATPYDASTNTFRALFLPGLLALISDAVGFVTLWFIDIGVIRELAITASIGVATIILTKLMFVPIAMSYVGIGDRAIEFVKKKQASPSLIWLTLSKLVKPKYAFCIVLISLISAGIGNEIRKDLKIGDLDPGAPELHPTSP
ncbi:MAG: RND family transporter, partial [Pseudomonadales bacterium]|nr:RND family transporter [Pseudomonadales bacterium]